MFPRIIGVERGPNDDKSGPNQNFRTPWPADLVALMAGRIYESMNCGAGWRIIAANKIVGMLDTIKHCLLSFVLEIEADAPDAGEAEPGTQPLPQERVTQVFNTYILGGTNTVAPGSTNVSQTIDQRVPAGDMNALKAFLDELGATTDDVAALETAIQEDGGPENGKRFGRRVTAWIGTMTKKAASGTLKVGTAVAGNVLSAALRSYYGLP